MEEDAAFLGIHGLRRRTKLLCQFVVGIIYLLTSWGPKVERRKVVMQSNLLTYVRKCGINGIRCAKRGELGRVVRILVSRGVLTAFDRGRLYLNQDVDPLDDLLIFLERVFGFEPHVHIVRAVRCTRENILCAHGSHLKLRGVSSDGKYIKGSVSQSVSITSPGPSHQPPPPSPDDDGGDSSPSEDEGEYNDDEGQLLQPDAERGQSQFLGNWGGQQQLADVEEGQSQPQEEEATRQPLPEASKVAEGQLQPSPPRTQLGRSVKKKVTEDIHTKFEGSLPENAEAKVELNLLKFAGNSNVKDEYLSIKNEVMESHDICNLKDIQEICVTPPKQMIGNHYDENLRKYIKQLEGYMSGETQGSTQEIETTLQEIENFIKIVESSGSDVKTEPSNISNVTGTCKSVFSTNADVAGSSSSLNKEMAFKKVVVKEEIQGEINQSFTQHTYSQDSDFKNNFDIQLNVKKEIKTDMEKEELNSNTYSNETIHKSDPLQLSEQVVSDDQEEETSAGEKLFM